MRTIEWEAPALASLAAAHWLVAYERENSPRKRVRYENEIEFDGVAYMLMCEIELVEREHKAVSMMCGIEPQYTDMPVRIIGNMGKAIGEILPVLNNFLDSYGDICRGIQCCLFRQRRGSLEAVGYPVTGFDYFGCNDARYGWNVVCQKDKVG